MPATLPCPKIPKQPAKKGSRLPSRSTNCACRNRMTACAIVRRIVFIGPPSAPRSLPPARTPPPGTPVLESAVVFHELQRLALGGHEVGDSMPGDQDGPAGIDHAGGLAPIPALEAPVNQPAGEGVPRAQHVEHFHPKSRDPQRLSPSR